MSSIKCIDRSAAARGLNIGHAEPDGGENPEEAQETDDEDGSLDLAVP